MLKKIDLKFIILAILLLGVIYRLIISSNGNFIFNMDNARDMVDVREIIALGKPRLIGQTTAIDGFFYGPVWYYLLAVPFILSGGNPYASILMEILMWAIGGYFLLKLVGESYGKLAAIAVGVVWIASNFILLASQYAFNPNPIIFLTPVFIYSLIKFIETEKVQFSLLCWLLAGLFLHFEITVGIFMPIVLILSVLILGKKKLFLTKNFWLGVIIYFLTLLPQIIFDLRHNFFLVKSLLEFKSGSHAGVKITFFGRLSDISHSYFDTLLPTFENFNTYLKGMIVLFFTTVLLKLQKLHILKDKVAVISLLLIFVPFFGLIPLKVDLMRWHLNAVIVAAIIMSGFVVGFFWNLSKIGKVVAVFLTVVIVLFSAKNIVDYIQAAKAGDTGNSVFKNELAVVDYIYGQAKGQNFKVYSYLPSVIDYPYQYLFWWRGLKKYGYLPEDYAYSPNVPEYIKYKNQLDKGVHPQDSGLTFLIKEPDQIGQRHLWENQFKKMELLNTVMIGAVTIETRK